MRCRRCSFGRSAQERGAALVVAMLVFAICTALVVAMKSEFMLYYQRGANLFNAEQAAAYLRGAEDLAALALVLDFDQDQAREKPRDDLNETWAQPATYGLDEGGWLSGALTDLQGRFNLNSLASGAADPGDADGGGTAGPDFGSVGGVDIGSERYTPQQRQFIRLLQALEEPQLSRQEAIQVTESIVDWLDSDSRVSPNGAEDDVYYGRTPAHRAANMPMASVTELRAVANVTPELYCALRPLVTVWPKQPAALNIHTAPATVLRSINSDDFLDPLSQADAEALVAQRQEPGFADVAEFLDHPVLAGLDLDGVNGLLGDTSSWFLLAASVEVADRTTNLYSVLRRERRQIQSVTRYAAAADPACLRRAAPGADEEIDGST
jgi:general secretion pathway protein K